MFFSKKTKKSIIKVTNLSGDRKKGRERLQNGEGFGTMGGKERAR